MPGGNLHPKPIVCRVLESHTVHQRKEKKKMGFKKRGSFGREQRVTTGRVGGV